jgi:hypothetical protein
MLATNNKSDSCASHQQGHGATVKLLHRAAQNTAKQETSLKVCNRCISYQVYDLNWQETNAKKQ